VENKGDKEVYGISSKSGILSLNSCMFLHSYASFSDTKVQKYPEHIEVSSSEQSYFRKGR